MCSRCPKECQGFCRFSSRYTIRQGSKPPLDQGHSSCSVVVVSSTFTLTSHKMLSGYFGGNAQPEDHSNVKDFYCKIYSETVDTVANCIVECFSQKNYTMYANCDQAGRNLSHKMATNCVSSTLGLTLIP